MDNQEQKTAIIYCRVSSKDQLEGTSLENQERICREYAERQNIKVLKVFTERGESAKTIDRTEFSKALVFVANKKNRVNYMDSCSNSTICRNCYFCCIKCTK